MDGHEYIKIYEKVFTPDLCNATIGISSEGLMVSSMSHPQIDNEMFQGISRVFHQYKGEFDFLTFNHSLDLMDDGYDIFQGNVWSRESVCENDEKGYTNRVATIIVFCDTKSEVEFPVQGLVIKGQVGRAIAFPAQWTHPFTFKGEGVAVRTNLMYNAG